VSKAYTKLQDKLYGAREPVKMYQCPFLRNMTMNQERIKLLSDFLWWSPCFRFSWMLWQL